MGTNMNMFEHDHQSQLKGAEDDALQALRDIVKDAAVRPALRIEAARVILDVRSQDAA